MSAINVVLLFILVWTFTAVCQADKDINVSCENVTGSVGKEVNLTCSVSLLINNCCIKNNMFKYKDSEICKQVLPDDSCEKRKNFTCSYTPTTVTEQFRFFVQASCGWKKPSFTVDTTGYLGRMNPTAAGLGFKDTVIAVVVSSLIIIIIIIMTIIYKTKPNSTKLCGFQNKMFLVVRHDKDSSNHKEYVI